MALVKVAQKKWAYTLYQDERQNFILSVLCGGVGMYELNIPISRDDGDLALTNSEILDKLAEEIRSHPQKYSEKSVKI